MRRRIGIHDCSVRYRQNMGLYTLSAIVYGDVRDASIGDGYEIPATTQVELILDTGAAHLGVKPSLFNLIQPRDVQPYQIVGASGTPQPSQRGLVDIVVDGRLRVNDVEIVELGELPYKNISGLLGMSFLQHFGMYFDVKTLRVIQNGGAEMPLLRFHYYSDENFEQD